MTDKYDISPTRLKATADIIEYIKSINDRVSSVETGLQIGHTAIEDGNLVVLNGDILVKESDGTTVLAILHGAVPEIRMFPLGNTDTHQASLLGFDFDFGGGVNQGVQLGIETTSEVQDGGKVLLTTDYAILSHQPQSGQETYLWINADSSLDEIISFRGRFRDSWQYDDHQAIYPGTFTVDAGFSTWTHTYANSFDGEPMPVATVNLNGSTTQWNLDSFLSSSFTLRFSVTAGGKDVIFWVFRAV